MNRLDIQGSTSVLEILYDSYREQHPMDTEKISEQYADLSDVLSKLTLKEHDRVWDLTCGLCTEHEKNGFLEGVRMGVSLAAELMEKRYWRSSR